MDYVLHLIVLISIYIILTVSLDLLIGYTGILTFGHAALYGVGAYAAAVLATKLGQSFLLALVAAFVVTGLVSLLLAIPTLRLGGDYFILALFGFSMIMSTVFDNWIDVTNGPYGIYGIPQVKLLGFPVSSGVPFLALTLALTAVVLFAKWRLVSAPFGITLRAIREDETVALVLGKDVVGIRVTVFALAGAATAIAGALLAYYLRFIDPNLFSFHFTIFLWAALFVGGSCGTLGTILGPAVLVLFPEALRFTGLSGTYVAYVQQGMYGLLLIVLMMFRPQGIAGGYSLR